MVVLPRCKSRRQRQPNIALAKKELGWEPRTQLKEGLGKTFAYFEKLLAEDAVLIGPLWPAPGAGRWTGDELVPVF